MAAARLPDPAFRHAHKAELDLVGGGLGVEAPALGRAAFPTDDRAQTAAVMAALAAAAAPIDVRALAAQFKGRKVADNVAEILESLVRTGYVATANNGATYALGRVN